MRFRLVASLLLLFSMLLSVNPVPEGVQAASKDIRIVLDGSLISSDVAPYVLPKANVTMVPLRVISENFGAVVDWSPAARKVTIGQGTTTIIMRPGQKTADVSGSSVTLDASAELKSGRVMVPLRFVGEALGVKVEWDGMTRTVYLNSGTLMPDPGAGNGGGSKSGLKAVWVSTIYNLDWPSTGSHGNKLLQQQEYSDLLDELQEMGINTVFVQVRPSGDALYPSDIVPWSKVLTGKQGAAPDYDPLGFMVEETHRRGMAFHAWFNPFRANTDSDLSKLAPNHVAVAQPDWVLKSGNGLLINPGIPDARQHIIDTIMEVVNGYDIDGVHLDDYFYPSSGALNDDATYRTYNANHQITKEDWRRDNINTFVRMLGESIHSAKPKLKFGISPFGVWRNKAKDVTGSDTSAGVTAYDSMSADVRTWIRQDWIDYVVPQIYWSLSFNAARYDKLVDWWAGEVAGTNVDLYIGHSPYKLGTGESGWQSAQEIIDQLKYNLNYPEAVKGDAFFSAKDLRRNPLGIKDALQAYYGAQAGQ
ncbi:family 10 glycosylhydrolase [Paenibacillus oenotherae]|uniref:Family 10 glycosylhydrolase n=1 Tax=Paenibacillus oenotherae TaxID=1435645 RepID=A0ABS7D3S4_9BACL|nr:family 10 glycosylhydrolase [Paenibacillus oenotherae]MBW7474580.1 family 10 glycosylhydrolase [Paenibacillus oenotherae]